jgi:hypothetical protein
MRSLAVTFHLPKGSEANWRGRRQFALYDRIEAIVLAKGGTVAVVARHPEAIAAGEHDGDGRVHIVENGNQRRPGFLNATLAYIPPYWHLDAMGVLADSAIAARSFDPATVAQAPAKRHFAALHARLVDRRRSRYRQREDTETLPAGAIAVFLQGRLPHQRGTAHCEPADLLRAVAKGAGGRPVLVKPHPLEVWRDLQAVLALQIEGYDLISTDANIHDILASSVATVSFNSAVALEGFLHRKPAILFGRADFHQFCETVSAPDDFPAALARGLQRRHGYEKFLYWYFAQNCLSLKAQDFEAQVLSRLDAAQAEILR